MTQLQQQERRDLNATIEREYIETAMLAASIDTHYHTTGRGTIIDLYEDFYFQFNSLCKLTASLDEMKQSEETITKTETWFQKDMPQNQEELKKHCFDGIQKFRDYAKSLGMNGLLALPVRGR